QRLTVGPVREMERTGARQEVAPGILRADACLDGVDTDMDLILCERQRLTPGHAQLPLDEIEPGDRLRYGVLHLEPGVHLEKVEVVAVEEKLHGAGALIADAARHQHRRSVQRLAYGLRQRGGGSLLDELLMPPLHRAVAVAEVHTIAVRVGEYLHLDMPRLRQVSLDEQRSITEGTLRQAARAGQRLAQLIPGVHDTHALAASAGGGLDDERQTRLQRTRLEVVDVLPLAVIAGQHRN